MMAVDKGWWLCCGCGRAEAVAVLCLRLCCGWGHMEGTLTKPGFLIHRLGLLRWVVWLVSAMNSN
jgi:hypothetical protein